MTSPTPYPPGQQGGSPPGWTSGPPPLPGTGGGWIPVGASAPPPPPPPTVPVGAGGGRRGRPALIVLGVALIVAGIGTAAGLALAGSQRYTDGIERLARSPANCVTTLDVAEEATYYFYVETKGKVDDVRGNCPTVGEDFAVDGDDDARLSLQDDDGETVRLRRAGGIEYDSGGYRGELVRSARLDAGSYQLAVEADDDVVVAVGRDVDGLKVNLLLPIIVGLAGLALGIAAVVLGRRRAPATAAGGAPPAQPPSGWSGFQPPPTGTR